MVMQMMFNNNAIGPNKSDDLDGNGGLSNSPWANIISIGLRIITTLLGGNTSDGIDKVDNGAAGPMQVSAKFLLLKDFINLNITNNALYNPSLKG